MLYLSQVQGRKAWDAWSRSVGRCADILVGNLEQPFPAGVALALAFGTHQGQTFEQWIAHWAAHRLRPRRMAWRRGGDEIQPVAVEAPVTPSAGPVPATTTAAMPAEAKVPASRKGTASIKMPRKTVKGPQAVEQKRGWYTFNDQRKENQAQQQHGDSEMVGALHIGDPCARGRRRHSSGMARLTR